MADNFKVNTNEYLNQCDEKDVMSFEPEKLISVSKLEDIVFQSFRESGIRAISNYLSEKFNVRETHFWFGQGGECEILRAGSQGWQKGKIKINVSLEFLPDELEVIQSPLDDVRQEFKQNN
jgi:hypothetical protein